MALNCSPEFLALKEFLLSRKEYDIEKVEYHRFDQRETFVRNYLESGPMDQMPVSRKFCQRGSNSAILTLFFVGKEDPNKYHLKQAGHHRHASETDDGPTLNAGFGLVALRILRISGDPVQYC